MAVEIMAYNVRDGFSDETRARGILDFVYDQKPDAMVFAEAYREGQEHLLDDVIERFDRDGYAVVEGLYEDVDGRLDRHGILGIVRHDIVAAQPSLLDLMSRRAIYLPMWDPETEEAITFLGAHLDDRQEPTRQQQTEELIAHADELAGDRPTVVGGDLNAMWGRGDVKASLLRAARPIARRLPTIEPRPDFQYPKLKRIGSLASRLSDMANGGTLQMFENAGFEGLDPNNTPTKGPFRLDHLLARHMIVLESRTYPKSELSDHRAIGATLTTR